MFEQFSDSSRRAIVWAQEEARVLDAAHIGAEHLLLGVAHEPDSDGAVLLARVGITADDLRAVLAGRREPRPLWRRKKSEHMPFTPEAKMSLERAAVVATEVTPAALVLGLLDLPDSAAVVVLTELGVDLDRLRELGTQALRPQP